MLVGVRLVASPVQSSTAEPEPFAKDLAFPTNMAFAPDGRLFFTEKDTGNVRIVQDGAVLTGAVRHPSRRAGRRTRPAGHRDRSRVPRRTVGVPLPVRRRRRRQPRSCGCAPRATTADDPRRCSTGSTRPPATTTEATWCSAPTAPCSPRWVRRTTPNRAQDTDDLGGKIVRSAPGRIGARRQPVRCRTTRCGPTVIATRSGCASTRRPATCGRPRTAPTSTTR